MTAQGHNKWKTEVATPAPAPSLTRLKRGVPIPAILDGDRALIPLTSRGYVVEHAIVDAADVADLEQYRWQFFDRRGQGHPSYAYRYVGRVTVPMHRQVMGLAPGNPWHIDHVNGDGIDNRRTNLRLTTRSLNMQNQHAQRRNATGYRGVRAQPSGRFTAQVGLRGKLHHGGTYDTAVEAAAVACQWRAEHMPFATHCGLTDCREGL